MSHRQKLLGFILFLFVSLISNFLYATDIEVIIAGKSYDSIDSYRASKRDPTPSQKPSPEVLDKKTEQAINQLTSVSSEQSVAVVKSDFDQNWDDPTPKFTIESQELEKRLEAIADNRKEPILVVSDNGKLRVMLMNENKK